jgi:hypothetical protein
VLLAVSSYQMLIFLPVHDGDPSLLPLGDALGRCAQRERTWGVCLPCHKALI